MTSLWVLKKLWKMRNGYKPWRMNMATNAQNEWKKGEEHTSSDNEGLKRKCEALRIIYRVSSFVPFKIPSHMLTQALDRIRKMRKDKRDEFLKEANVPPLSRILNVTRGMERPFALVNCGQNSKSNLIWIMMVHGTRCQSTMRLLGVRRHDLWCDLALEKEMKHP